MYQAPFDILTTQAHGGVEQLSQALRERQAFYERWADQEKWLLETQKKVDAFNVVFSDEVNDVKTNMEVSIKIEFGEYERVGV